MFNWIKPKAVHGTVLKGDTWELEHNGLVAYVGDDGTWMLCEDERVKGPDYKTFGIGVENNANEAKAKVEALIRGLK